MQMQNLKRASPLVLLHTPVVLVGNLQKTILLGVMPNVKSGFTLDGLVLKQMRYMKTTGIVKIVRNFTAQLL